MSQLRTNKRHQLASNLSPKKHMSRLPKKIGKETSKDPTQYQKLHLVLDLDATLVSTLSFEDDEDSSKYENVQSLIQKLKATDTERAHDLERRVHIFSLNDGGCKPYKMWTILRPDTFKFIEFASKYFDRISIWSAGKTDYVNEIVSLLFPPYLSRPEIVLSWSNCEKSYLEKDVNGIEYIRKSVDDSTTSDFQSFTKPLKSMGKYIGMDGKMDMSKIIIVDDRSDIASCNAKNLVQIPPYAPIISETHLMEEKDIALSTFTKWLMSTEVVSCQDVRKITKNNIFHQQAQPKKLPIMPSPSHAIPLPVTRKRKATKIKP
jgi:hypothetical protein